MSPARESVQLLGLASSAMCWCGCMPASSNTQAPSQVLVRACAYVHDPDPPLRALGVLARWVTLMTRVATWTLPQKDTPSRDARVRGRVEAAAGGVPASAGRSQSWCVVCVAGQGIATTWLPTLQGARYLQESLV